MKGKGLKAKAQTRTHIWIPDTQIEPGRPTKHVDWIGQFIADEYNGTDLVVIQGGDWWNMGSLSSYDKKGGTRMEGRRYVKDIDSGNDAFIAFHNAFAHVPCRRVFLHGNHENRIVRAYEQDATLDGAFSLDHLIVNQGLGWESYDFLDPVLIDGITYSHYFYNPNTGRPYAGQNIETRLKQVLHSFTMGHQQGRKWGQIQTIHGTLNGLVAGSCYLHEEDYLGPQALNHWRGIVVCHEVHQGDYDPMFVSLDYLSRRYDGKRLAPRKSRGHNRNNRVGRSSSQDRR